MPSAHWSLTTFGALIDDGALEIGDGYRAKNAELGGDGPIFLRAGHVRDTHVDFNGVDRFQADLAQRVASKMSQAGDTMVTTKGNSTGRVAYVNGDMPPFVYSPHLSYWRVLDQEVLVPGFVRFWSRGSEFRNQLSGLAASTDMAPYLSLVDQKRLKVTVPPVSAQRAIAHILGALDDKIELNRKMNQTLEEMARSIFKSWFVDFDPVRAKAEGRKPVGMDAETAALFPDGFEDSELGEIPRGWRLEPLDQVASCQNGLALQRFRPEGSEEALPVIKIAQLRSGQPDSGEWATASIKPECIIDDGDVVFSWSGSLMVVVWGGGRGALNQHLFKVTSELFPKWFYLHATLNHLPEFQSIAADKATTMGHIKRHHLTDALCAVPPQALLARTTPLFDSLLARGQANMAETRTLTDLRDTLLPKLLSGELRINDAEKFVEGAS